MATIDLPTVLLAAVSDLAVALPLEVSSLKERRPSQVRIGAYAGGRRRSFRRAGKGQSSALALVVNVLDRDQLATLQAWEDELVLYRDPRGRKLYGTLVNLDIDENVAAVVATVSFTVEQLTHSEAV